MDNLVNSLVGDVASNAGNASGLQDYQGKSYDPKTILALAKQITASIDPNAVKGGVFSTKGESIGFNYDQATNLLGHAPSATEQVALDMARHLSNEGVTDLNNVDATGTNRRFGSTYTGGGGTIYEIKKDADGKPIISTWSKDTSDKKAIIGGLALAALAFGIPGVSEGLLSGASTGSTIGTLSGSTIGAGGATALEGASALSSLGALGGEAAVAGMGTGTGLTLGGAGGLGGATGVSSLGGSLGTGLTTAGAGGLGGAGGAAGLGGLGTGVGAGVGGMAATNSLLGNAALGSTLANTATGLTGSALGALGNAGGSLLGSGAATSALGTTLGQGLALNALGSGLGAVANQSGISNARDLINQYGTKAQDVLTSAYGDQKGVYAGNRADLLGNFATAKSDLGNTLASQRGIYDATNTNLANTYGKTQSNLYDIYNQQVGIQQPYQAVGQAGSEGLVGNQDYFNRQFTNADLNSNLAPNYAFQLQQGQMANQRAANMGGGSLGGNALQGLQRYTQDYAGNAYQNAFTNFQNQRQNIYNTLSGMANIGTTSGGQLASLGNTLGGNLGSLSSAYGGNVVSNTGQMQGAYNQYGSNLTSLNNTLGSNLTSGSNAMLNAGSLYGANQAGLATGIGSALAGNASASGANTATALSNLGNTALLGSMLRAT